MPETCFSVRGRGGGQGGEKTKGAGRSEPGISPVYKEDRGHFSLRLKLVTLGNVFKTSVPIPFHLLSSFPKHDAVYIVKGWKL